MPARILVLALLAAAAIADSDRPRYNASFVPEADDTARGLVAQAEQAAAAGDTEAAAQRLQALLAADSPGLVPVRGRELFVPPARWALLKLLGEEAPFGPEVVAAWRRLHDREAGVALLGALASRDEQEVLRLVRRYPAATLAPTALLALADRAVQRGDPEGARALLLRLPEHLARSEEAAWFASGAWRARRDHLAATAKDGLAHWPTLGGDATRARNGAGLPPLDRLDLRWESRILEEAPPGFELQEADRDRDYGLALPFYPVCDARRLYVHLGACVAVLDRATGKRLAFLPDGEPPDPFNIEGLFAESPGVRAATIADGRLYFCRVGFEGFDRVSHRGTVLAYDLAREEVAWEVPPAPAAERGGENWTQPLFFRGAPAVVGGRVYVYGAAREQVDGVPTRKEEAHLLCLRARDGHLLWHRFLGSADTEAAPSLPPQSGLAPAVGAGVVVAVTGAGVAAAFDASTGEPLWVLRHDRAPVRERERLTEWTDEQVHPSSGWSREAPRIVGDSVIFAPFDAEEAYACWLRGRRDPADGAFRLVQWSKGRTRHLNSLLEHVAGITGDRIYYVGRRDPHHSPEAYQAVVSHPLASEVELAYGRLPPTERATDGLGTVPPEVYGRPVIAGDLLLVPTRRALFPFAVGRAPEPAADGRGLREIPAAAPCTPPTDTQGPRFGTLVAVDGILYAATVDRILCYVARN